MLHFVCFAWIFFLAPSFPHAIAILARLGKGTFATSNLAPRIVGVLLLGAVTHFLGSRILGWIRDLFVKSPPSREASRSVRVSVASRGCGEGRTVDSWAVLSRTLSLLVDDAGADP